MQSLKYIIFIALLVLAGCGDSDSSSSVQSQNQSDNNGGDSSSGGSGGDTGSTDQGIEEVSLEGKSGAESVIAQQVSGKVTDGRNIVDSSFANAVGSLRDSGAGQGNLTLGVNASDPDGMTRIVLFVPSVNRSFELCAENCGTEFLVTLTGINPHLMGATPGATRFELFVGDAFNNLVGVDAITVNWQPIEISAVSAKRENGVINVSWQGNSSLGRYNLYAATQHGVNSETILSLDNGVQKLAILGTSIEFNDAAPEKEYHLFLTGINAGGESGLSPTLTVARTDDSANIAPVANDDQYQIVEEQVLVTNIISNDSDANGQLITLSAIIENPSNGEVTFTPAGQIVYTPSLNFFGQDRFVYQISDTEGSTALGTVEIEISAVNDNPVAADDSFILKLDKSLSISFTKLLENDSDVDGDSLTVLAELASAPSFGTVEIDSEGGFNYQATSDFIDNDSFEYQVSDGQGGLSQARIFLLLNTSDQAPVATNDSFQTNEDTQLVVNLADNGVLANDFDPNERTIQLVNSLVTLPQHGQLNLASDGTFSYIPDSNFFGADHFEYQIINSIGATAQAVVTIDVLAQDDTPIALNDNYQVNEDNLLTVSTIDGLLNNDTDPDLGTLIVNTTAIVSPRHGILLLKNDGSFSYQANENFNGQDSFSYQVSNLSGKTRDAQAFITVVSVNDTPIVGADSYAVDEDNTLNGTSVLVNDSDVDGDNLVINTTPVVNVNSGSLTLLADGTFTYVPLANSNGSDSFTYSVSDGNGESAQAVVSITVNAINDTPIAINDSYILNEDSVLNGTTVLSNDNDIDGDSLTFNTTPTKGVSNGSLTLNIDGSFVYSPNANFTGNDSFTYSISDPGNATAQAIVNLAVNNVNDTPTISVVANDFTEDSGDLVAGTSVAASYTTNDLGDGDTLTVSFNTASTHYTVDQAGSVYLTSAGINVINLGGTLDAIDLKVTDDNATPLSSTNSDTPVVTTVNDTPTISVVANDFTEDSGGLVAGTTVAANYTTDDLGDGDTLTISFNTASTHYTLNQLGNVYLTSAAISVINLGGMLDAIDLKVTDDNATPLSSSASDTSVVTTVNDTPTISVVANDFTEDSGGLVAGTSVAASYTTDDLSDGDTLTVSFNTASTHYTVNQAGSVYLTIAGINVINLGGTLDAIDLKVTDDNATPLSSSASDTPVVTTVNDTPTISVVANDFTEDSGGLVAGTTVAANYTTDDLGDGDTLTTSFNTASTHYTVNQAGSVYLTSAAISVINLGGTLDAIDLKVTDDNATPLSSTNSDTPVVTTVNDTPTISVVANDFTEDSGGLVAGTSVAASYTTNDLGDGDTLTVSFNTASTHYTVNQVGSVYLTSAAISVINLGGTLDAIDLKVTDDNTTPLSSTSSDTPVVTTVNDTPTISVVANDFTEDSGGLVAGTTVAANYTTNDLGDGDTLTISFNTASTHYTLNQLGNVYLTSAAISVINLGGTLDAIDLKVTDDNATPLSSSASDTPVVTTVNDTPTISVVANDFTEDSGGLVAGTSVAASYTTNDLGDGDTLTVSFNTASTHYTVNQVGSVYLTSAAISVINLGGTLDAIDLKVTDDNTTPLSSTSSDTPVVTTVNDTPTISVVANDFTEDSGGLVAGTSVAGSYTTDDLGDGDTMTTSFNTASTHYTVNQAGSVYLTSAAISVINLGGTLDAIDLKVTDDNATPLSSTNSDTPVVTTVNDTPTISVVANDFTEDSGGLVAGTTVAANYTTDDLGDGDTLTISFNTASTHYTVNQAGSVYLTSAAISVINLGGTLDAIDLKVTDDNATPLSSTNSDTPVVTAVNDTPTISVVANDFTEDSGGLVAGTSVAASYTTDDLGDGDTLTISFNTASTHYTVNQAGSVYLTSAAINIINAGGSLDTIDLKITDDNATPLSSSASDTPVVTAVNDAPTGTTLVSAANEEVLKVIDISSNVTDEDGTVNLTTTVKTSGPTNGTLINNNDGTFDYTGANNFVGTDSFTYTVQDNNGQVSSNITVTINVSNINDAPTAVDQSFAVDEDKSNGFVIGTVVASDVESNNLSYAITGGATSLFNIGAATGIVTVNGVTPLNYEISTQHSITVDITDDGTPSESKVITVTINVNNVVEGLAPSETGGFGRASEGFLELTGVKSQTQLNDSVRNGNYIYFVGTTDNINKDIIVVKYKDDGSVPIAGEAFGTNGVAIFDFGNDEDARAITNIGGDYFISFNSDNGTHTEVCFIQIDLTGDININFGDNGIRCTTEQKTMSINDAVYIQIPAIQGNAATEIDTLVAVGKVKDAADDDLLVIRVDKDGNFQTSTTFVSGVEVTYSPHIMLDVTGSGLNDEGIAVYNPHNDEVMVAGNVLTAEGDYDIFAWIFNPKNANGNYDKFNSSTPVVYDVGGIGTDDKVGDIDGENDGAGEHTAHIAGSTILANGEQDAFIIELDSYAAYVSGFGTNGIAIYDVDGISSTGKSEFTDYIYNYADNDLYLTGTLFDGTNYQPFATRVSLTGVVDTGYGSSGYQKVDYAGDNAYSKTMSMDGSKGVWVPGYVENGSDINIAISAFDSGGSFLNQNDFVNGKNTLTQSSTPSDDVAASTIKVQNGAHAGKYLVASVANDATNNNLILSRFTAAGLLDTSFDTDGHKQIFIGTSAQINGLIELSSGKLILYGNTSIYDSVDAGTETHGFIVQLDAEGQLDTSFATNGRYITKAITATSINFNQAAIDGNGKIVAVGTLNGDAFILRLTTAGVLDTGFNASGHNTGNASHVYNSLAIDGSNNIYSAGYQSGGNKAMLIAKYTTAGILDTGFNSVGTLVVDVDASADDYAEKLLRDVSGNLYLVGNSINTPNKVAIVKMSATGVLDISYSGDGITNLVMAPSDANANVQDVKLDTNNNLIVAGYSDISGVNKSMLGRVTPLGVLDTLFNATGHYQTATCSNAAQFNSIILNSDTNMVLAGQCYIDGTLKNNIEFSQYQLLEP